MDSYFFLYLNKWLQLKLLKQIKFFLMNSLLTTQELTLTCYFVLAECMYLILKELFDFRNLHVAERTKKSIPQLGRLQDTNTASASSPNTAKFKTILCLM